MSKYDFKCTNKTITTYKTCYVLYVCTTYLKSTTY